MKNGRTVHKSTFFHLFFSLLSTITSAQARQHNTDFWNRVQIRGGLGMDFGNNSYNASVSTSGNYRTTIFCRTGAVLG